MSKPRIVFRTDASIQIGTGHVMRCLTLAGVLRGRGAECLFIFRPHQGHMLDLIAQHRHSVVSLPTVADSIQVPDDPTHAHWLGTDWVSDAEDTRQALGAKAVDWLVIDHYALDRRWEQALRPLCQRLMVIDDLADRLHDCDLLLDQNLGRTTKDYSDLLPHYTTTLIGPQYALLRPEFAQLRAKSLARRINPQLKHLLITMGGVDKDNMTGRVLDTLKACSLPPDLHIAVVMGPRAPWLQQVRAQAAQMNRPTQVLVGVSNMARLMTDSDLAIGAAGSTSWERCCLGLPAIQLTLASNQIEIAKALAQADAVLDINPEPLHDILSHIFNDQSAMQDLLTRGRLASAVADGLGTQRVTSLLLKKER